VIPGFIILTDDLERTERIRIDFIGQYGNGRGGGSFLMLGNRDTSEFYKESPEEIDAKIREACGVAEPGFTCIPLSESLPSEGEQS
jgi:hypothetical protein